MGRKNEATDVFQSINMHNGDRSVCWEWKGNFNEKDQRPYFTLAGRKRPAYTIVLELVSGEMAQGRVARHICDKGEAPVGCCNPSHLEWGTHQDNMNDMVKRERHGLPAVVVRAIKKLIDEGRTHERIAELYGISRESVTDVANGRTARSADTGTTK